MQTGEICSRNVIVADGDTGIARAAQLMRDHHVGTLVIVRQEDGWMRPLGIVTDRDIVVEVVAREVAPPDLAIKDIMARDLVTAQAHEDLFDTLERMRQRGVRRVPVVDARGALVGLLALDDVTELLAEKLADIPRLVRRERKAEVETRS